MSPKPKIAQPTKVVLCWHMHQPYYREQISGQYQLPWTYLHAIKDYIDMANIIESIPHARAVVNFCPTLLEQIDDYRLQIQHFFENRQPLNDPLLAQLVAVNIPGHDDDKKLLIQSCLRANEKRLIASYAPYMELATLAREALKSDIVLNCLNERFFFDLVSWYHLAWLGETVKISNPIAQTLLTKGHNFSFQDRLQLLEVIGHIFNSLIPKYRKLAELGQIELSVTPYSHPIMPLMLDMQSAHEALPNALLPAHTYPGGQERVQWQLSHAKKVFMDFFGFEPKGCWPSEGAVSIDTLHLIEAAGFSWTASGGSVLNNSLRLSDTLQGDCIHRPYHISNSNLFCFFRDDNLSDLIGFNYSSWHADDAVNNFIHHLTNISEACKEDGNRVVAIILDGENCWEYYSHNGYHFLKALYAAIAEHPSFDLTTFQDAIQQGTQSRHLLRLVAGSWVHGTFSTWVGQPAKNQVWELLIEAKNHYDRVIKENKLPDALKERAQQQLAICEASDWSWWCGDYNAEDSVRLFDNLYRTQLKTLYQILGETPPAQLDQRIAWGSKDSPDNAGTMRRANEN